MTREKDVHTFFCGHKPGAMPRCPSPARRAPRIRGVYVCRRVDTHESRINNTVQIKLLNQTPNTSKKKIKEDQKVLPGTRNPDRIYVFYCCSQPNRTTQSLNSFFFRESILSVLREALAHRTRTVPKARRRRGVGAQPQKAVGNLILCEISKFGDAKGRVAHDGRHFPPVLAEHGRAPRLFRRRGVPLAEPSLEMGKGSAPAVASARPEPA